MEKMATPDVLLMSNGERRLARPENGTDYTLEELYKLLECEMIEVVQVADPRYEDYILICDEEGTFVPEPKVNWRASDWARTQIVGHALMCHTSRLK